MLGADVSDVGLLRRPRASDFIVYLLKMPLLSMDYPRLRCSLYVSALALHVVQ